MSFTVSRPCAYEEHRIYFLAYTKNEPGTRVFRWTNKWDNYHVPFIAGGVAALRGDRPAVITMGVEGSLHLAGPEGFSAEHVDTSAQGPAHRGVLRDIRVIADTVYVAGLGRQVYRRTAPGRWERFDHDIVEPLGSDSVGGFESIDGFDQTEIYAVGMAGEMYWCNADRWRQISSPTNLILTKVLCCPDGVVYAVGQGGILLRGRGESWEQIEHGVTDETFWDAAWHGGSLWLSSTASLYRLDDSSILSAVTIPTAAADYRYLSTVGSVLVAAGGRQIVTLQDDHWVLIAPP